MKRIEKIILTIIFFLGIIFCANNVNATSINVSPSNPKVGDTITITVTVPNVHTVTLKANISGAVSGTIKMAEGDLSGDAKNYSKSAQFKCEKEGIITIATTQDSRGILNGQDVNVAASANVKVSAVNENNSNEENGENASDSNSGSNSNSGSSSNSGSNSSSGIVENSGSSSNSDSSQTAITKSNNALLSNLGITPNDFTGFSPSKMSYTVTVPNNVENIEVYAKKGQDKQTISGTGKKTLNEGENTFQVSVTAEDGKTKKTYTIVVTRKKANEDQGNQTEDNVTDNEEQTEENLEDGQGEVGFGLSDLKIGTLTLKPEFKTDIYEYSAKLIGTQSGVDIETTATEANAKVEITGNDDLKDGENIITIMVTDGAGEKTVTYQITLQKSEVDEEAIAKQKEIEEAEKQKKILAIAIAVVLSVLIIVIIVISKRKKNMYAEQYTLPFANLNNDESQDEGQEEIKGNVKEEYLNQEMQDDFDDVPVKKKHGKGKRFK